MPAVITLIVFVVAPVLHLILPVQLLAVNVADSPLHNVFLLVLMIGAAALLLLLIISSLLILLSPQIFKHLAV